MEKYLEIEYEGWHDAIVKTNSTHRKGISFLHGDVTVSFVNIEGLKSIVGWTSSATILLRLMSVPKGKKAPKKEVDFTVMESSNPKTVFDFSPVTFTINQIRKSRQQGFQPYNRYFFYFSAALFNGKNIVCSVDGETRFEMTTSTIKKKDPQIMTSPKITKTISLQIETQSQTNNKQRNQKQAPAKTNLKHEQQINPLSNVSFELNLNDIVENCDFISMLDFDSPFNELDFNFM